MWIERLKQAVEKIENLPLSLGGWALSFFAIVVVRMTIENFFEGFPFRFADHYFYFFTDFFLSFAFTLLLVLPIICWAGRVPFVKAANLGLFTFLIIWFPPIIDEVISHGNGLWSFYCFDSLTGLLSRYLTFFGENPEVGITYGVRTEIGLVTLFVCGYALLKTRQWWRAAAAALLLYTALFFIATLPSFVAILLLGPERGPLQVTSNDVAALMLTPEQLFGLAAPSIASVLNLKVSLLFAPLLTLLATATVFVFFRNHFWALFNNARWPQVFYHAGLFLIGGALVFVYGSPAFVVNFFHLLGIVTLLIAIICAWTASVIVNDIYDVSIDRITNPSRPLIQGHITPSTYATIGSLYFIASIIFAAIVSTQAALLLVVYQAIAWLYSAPPLRLKRFPFIATLLAASASLLVFFSGYIVFSADKHIVDLPGSVALLLFLAYTALLPIKDFKDIEGDRADGVITLPVLWGEVRAKRLIGIFAFACFIASVFVFDVRHLFPLAFFFGSLAYWLLQISSVDHRYFRYHRLAGWYVLLVSGYVFFLVWHFLSR